MFLRRVLRSAPGNPVSRGHSPRVPVRPSFCVALSLPLPLPLALSALPRSGAMREPAPATLHLSFCSGGGGRARAHVSGCGGLGQGLALRQADKVAAVIAGTPDRNTSVVRRPAQASCRLPSGDARERSWRRLGDRLRASLARDAAGCGGELHRDGGERPGVLATGPDSFAIAMQQWPISFAAFAGWPGAFVGILHFCDAIPGLPRSRHSSFRSRVTSADPRFLHNGRDASGQPFVSFRVSSSTSSWR